MSQIQTVQPTARPRRCFKKTSGSMCAKYSRLLSSAGSTNLRLLWTKTEACQTFVAVDDAPEPELSQQPGNRTQLPTLPDDSLLSFRVMRPRACPPPPLAAMLAFTRRCHS
eukprot:m.41731 g.41731  ORF g.41731 m.41731 type:complete len:111 (-) comp46237_c0_seq1:747-1079(-)